MSGITLSVNHIPNVIANWPKGVEAYICGTVPYNNAECLANTVDLPFRSNVENLQPWTFAGCCNGPIINITQPVTDPSDPSNGAVCLAYCEVDYARQIESLGEYWQCLSNTTVRTRGRQRNEPMGHVTCGWVNKSEHEKCEISVSLAMSMSSTAAMASATSMGNSTAAATTAFTQTRPTCPAERTSRVSEPAASPTRNTRNGASRSGVGLGSALMVLALGSLVLI